MISAKKTILKICNKIATLQGDISTLQGDITALQGACPFPIGSIYMSLSSDNPSTIWSGTNWARFAVGRTLIGVDENDNDFKEADLYGGVKSVTLSASQSGLPAHTHTTTIELTGSSLASGSTYSRVNDGGSRYSGIVNVNSNDAKNATSAHTNLQPYKTCYIWKRTA